MKVRHHLDEDMANQWDQHAAGWDTNDDVVVYSERAFEGLEKISKLAGLAVLDFGCGTGLLTAKVAGQAEHVIGIDTSDDMLAVLRAKKLSNVTALNLELGPESVHHPQLKEGFDLILASSVCAFVDDYPATVAVFAELLKPGGLLVQWDWRAESDDADWGLTETQLRSAFESAGLTPLTVNSAFSMTMKSGEAAVLMGVAKKPTETAAGA